MGRVRVRGGGIWGGLGLGEGVYGEGIWGGLGLGEGVYGEG